MPNKKSTATKETKDEWKKNLIHFEKSKRLRKNESQESLGTICKMPTNWQIINRYTSLASD